MRKMSVRFVSVMLAVLLVLCQIPAVFAEENSNLPVEELASKVSGETEEEGRYEITLSVPGAYSEEKYAEIILMVDASDSQQNNFGELKKLINKLGDVFLIGDGSMRLSLMGFGVGPKHAGTFTTQEDLEAFLETVTAGDLMQERSATNCEVALTFVREYIENSPNLSNAYVIFTSDGGANLDETPAPWSQWQDTTLFDYFRNFRLVDIVNMTTGIELERIYGGGTPLAVTAKLYPQECADLAAALAEFGPASEGLSAALDLLADKMMADGAEYVDALLQDIFESSGLAWEEAHSASVVEGAFARYFRSFPGLEDPNYDSYMDLFYVILGDSGKTSPLYANRYMRAAEASKKLQENEKVYGLFHVGYSGASNTWMNPANSSVQDFYTDKLRYVYNTTFAQATDDMEDLSESLVVTAYKDVTITDPMSKWVTLDPETIRIFDGETVIWQYGQGWLIGEPPVAGEPVVLEINEDGRQQITWKVKDGFLYRSDRYSLRYMVDINASAEGFEYGVSYPANDPTTVSYTDEEGVAHNQDIPVPSVELPEDETPPVTGESSWLAAAALSAAVSAAFVVMGIRRKENE